MRVRAPAQARVGAREDGIMDEAFPSGLDLNDRSPTVYGWVLMLLGGGGLLYFWVMGAIGLLTGNAGTIVLLQLEGAWRVLFLAYPAVFLVSLVLGAALVALKKDLASLGVAGAPVALSVVYYLALLYLRPV